MRDNLAGLVHRVLSYGLNLREQLESGQRLSLNSEQAHLRSLIEALAVADPGASDQVRQIQYALACWLDEIFIMGSPWRVEWNERSLEVGMGFNQAKERAWRFPEMAQRAGADLLEVCYLCVMLGFRGEWADKPDALRNWVEAARAQLRRSMGGEHRLEQTPPELDPPDRKIRRGREQMDTMARAWGIALVVLVPLVAFSVAWLLLNR
jgi:type VI secretion system protein ImpK